MTQYDLSKIHFASFLRMLPNPERKPVSFTVPGRTIAGPIGNFEVFTTDIAFEQNENIISFGLWKFTGITGVNSNRWFSGQSGGFRAASGSSADFGFEVVFRRTSSGLRVVVFLTNNESSGSVMVPDVTVDGIIRTIEFNWT